MRQINMCPAVVEMKGYRVSVVDIAGPPQSSWLQLAVVTSRFQAQICKNVIDWDHPTTWIVFSITRLVQITCYAAAAVAVRRIAVQVKYKVKYADIAVHSLTATGTQMPYT